MRIEGREIGYGHPAFIVAEISCSHEGSLDKALELIRYAAWTGADAVKFQLWLNSAELTRDSDDPRYTLQSGPWAGRRLWDLYGEALTPLEWFPQLFKVARGAGLIPFCSPFSPAAVAYLSEPDINCPAFKIASMEIGYLPLLQAVAETGRPIILSTGMASRREVSEALRTIHRWSLLEDIALLHCVSGYPTPINQMNLDRMFELDGMADLYGLSDHSPGHLAPILAVALGASIIEKHIMLPLPNESLDKGHSLEPIQFKAMVDAVRETESAMGDGSWAPNPAEADSQAFKRRLVDGEWVRCAGDNIDGAGSSEGETSKT